MKITAATTQVVARKFAGALLIATTLTATLVLSAPSQQQQQQAISQSTPANSPSSSNLQRLTNSVSNSGSSSSVSSSSSPSSTSNSKPTSTAIGQHQAAASAVPSPLPSQAHFLGGSSLRDGATNAKANSYANDDEMNTFDGKNPFADDSLWQIPIHLVRDLSSNSNDKHHNQNKDSMTKSASSEVSSADERELADEHEDMADADESPVAPGAASSLSRAPSSPTIISASTDLKTAAGYHHQTHGGYHGHDLGHGYGHGHHSYGDHHAGNSHEPGHYGAGHHGGDHYGKYFQYASVPYPYAWDFGYRRGNPYHTIERYEHGKGPHFQTKVKWADKHGGYGVHVWDYNHDDHHSNHYGGDHGHHDSYAPAHHYAGDSHHGGHHYGGHP